MGTHGRKIVDTDVGDLVKLLNKAYSDEWLAYYQYWIGSKVVRGPNKEAVIAELTLHATEELGHAVLLTTRIIQLGGTPITKPQTGTNTQTAGMMPPMTRSSSKCWSRTSRGSSVPSRVLQQSPEKDKGQGSGDL